MAIDAAAEEARDVQDRGAGHPVIIIAARDRCDAVVSVSLVAMSYAVPYGLSKLPANRAIVILLFELVVAAFAAYFLAGETLSFAKIPMSPFHPGLRCSAVTVV